MMLTCLMYYSQNIRDISHESSAGHIICSIVFSKIKVLKNIVCLCFKWHCKG